jgi:hypothetical protein
LVSLALAPEDRNAVAFYRTVPCANPEPSVADWILSALNKRPFRIETKLASICGGCKTGHHFRLA